MPLPHRPSLAPPSNRWPAKNHRILVIDDNRAIHEDIRKVLLPPASPTARALADLETQLFRTANSPPADPAHTPEFVLDSAYQGREGLALVEQANAADQPYAMAFVDVRMPPGWDGVETTLELWKVAPDLQIVICTAYSDYSWDEMLARIGGSDRLVILKKPFDTIEVLQLAKALTEKWNLLQETRTHAADLEDRVRVRTAELEASNLALQHEIARRIEIESDLQRATEAAESATRAKSAFLANMSHEIRTPMNGILGMAHLLMLDDLSDHQRELAETLCRSSETLLTIINDILDFSKIESGHLSLETIDFDLTKQVELVVDLHAETAASKGLELILEIDPTVPRCLRGDPLRLRQILLNLVGNALKFTSQGEVSILVRPAPARSGRVGLRCEISDTGIGVAPDVQGILFRPFTQADNSTTRKYGGTGLGLAICKRLVELMHGDIGVVSELGAGSTFWFTLEASPAEICEPSATASLASLAGIRVLFVDDNATNRALLAHLLTRWEVAHHGTDGAAGALSELRRATAAGTPYDLVLLDYHMPETDGLQLAAQICADHANGSPQLVLLTSRGERLPADELEARGLAACELKPLHAERLYATLGRVLRRSIAGGTGAETVARDPAAAPRPETRILLAEDNPVNQRVSLLILHNLGYVADVACDGREVLEALRRQSYALVLMDSQMPEMDGLETTRLIRKAQAAGEPGFPADLRIVAMTAHAMPGDREACLAAGMDDYLPKPVRPKELKDTLARHLSCARPAIKESRGIVP